MKRRVIVIILALLLLLAAGSAYFFYFRDRGLPDEEQAENYEYAIEDSFVTNVKNSSKLFKTSIVFVFVK